MPRRRRSPTRSNRPKRVVVDLSDVEFIDSTGLRLIVSADARIRREGRMLELVKGPDRVHRVFRMTLMNERLAFIDHTPGDPPLPPESFSFPSRPAGYGDEDIIGEGSGQCLQPWDWVSSAPSW